AGSAGSALGTLPATFAGLLPCPDCVGARCQINLLPGGAYMRRSTYLLNGRDEVYYDLGAWSIAGDGTLILSGDREGDTRWPVEVSGEYRTLERVYTVRRAAPGSELLVTLQVRIEPRPKMEGKGPEPTLIVEKFVDAMPGRRCDEQPPQSDLEDSRWRPVRIGD